MAADAAEDAATPTTTTADPGVALHRLELVATVVLALTTVLTAWAGFQAAKWRGIEADEMAAATAARTESTRASTRAGQENLADVVLYTQWLDAVAEDPALAEAGDGPYQPSPGTLAAFYHERMRPEMRTALDAWLATDPLDDPDAAPTPFDLPEYQLATMAEADDMAAQADDLSASSDAAGRQGDDYVLLTVLLASALFFAGISTKLRSPGSTRAMLALSTVVVLASAALLVAMPKQL